MREIEEIQTMYGTFFSWEGDVITRQLKKCSAHTRNELAMLKSFIREGDDILDLGAHIGTFSMPFARFNGGKGRIFSFEADIDNYGLLDKNIKANSLEAVVFPTHGVISQQENKMYSSSLPKGGNSGMHYFFPCEDSDEYSVKSIHIDAWMSNEKKFSPRLIKADVEGAELSVLLSCVETIDRYKPMLYIELNAVALDRFDANYEEIEKYLLDRNYQFFRNLGVRNSEHDEFELASMKSLREGGEFFDLLAIHSLDERLPK